MNSDISRLFAQFIATTAAVKFGDFVLKSGKKSSIFYDFGSLAHGEELIELGRFYADYLVDRSLHQCDAIFGPAYKGINISIATSIALYQKHGVSLPFVYNRKTAKTHAERGTFVGYNLANAKRVVVVDDVITDGGTKFETIEMLSIFPTLQIVAFVVGVDRQEKDSAGQSCIDVFRNATGLPVYALTTSEEVLQFRNHK